MPRFYRALLTAGKILRLQSPAATKASPKSTCGIWIARTAAGVGLIEITSKDCCSDARPVAVPEGAAPLPKAAALGLNRVDQSAAQISMPPQPFATFYSILSKHLPVTPVLASCWARNSARGTTCSGFARGRCGFPAASRAATFSFHPWSWLLSG